MITPHDVEAAFRMILGRPPESEAVVEAHLGAGSLPALRRALMRSEEFRMAFERLEAERVGKAPGRKGRVSAAPKKPGADAPLPEAQGILLPPNTVDTRLAPADRETLFARVADSWSAMGRTAPHWSVLTHERFRPEAFEDNREAFVRSAGVEGLLVDAALERVPDARPAEMTCLEIGCGVGRATRELARRFAGVIGVDISPDHLEIARSEFAAEGLGNTGFEQVRTVADYERLPRFDMLYSRIVLQHNPPPVQEAVLRAVFTRLRPRGIALFQAVTHIEEYAYVAAEDVASTDRSMEMHALPQPVIFALMSEAGLKPLEVQEDFAAGNDGRFRSHLFLARKG